MEDFNDGSKKKKQFKASGMRHRFNAKDYELLVTWLEMLGHLETVIGTEGKTKVGGKFPNKKQAFTSMAQYVNDNQLVNQKTRLETVLWEGARNRFMTLPEKYRTTRDEKAKTGWGLTDDDTKKKIHTIEAKVALMCPCFDRLDALFGESPNIQTKENDYVSSTKTHSEQMPQPPPRQDPLMELLEADGLEPLDSTPRSPTVPCVPESLPADGPSPPPKVDDGPTSHPPVMGTPPEVVQQESAIPSPPNSTASTAAPAHVTSETGWKSTAPPTKKANTGKGPGFATSFANSLESIFERKAKSMDMKERLSLRWFKLEDDKLKLEDDKLKLEEARMLQHNSLAKAQVLQSIINENSHRSPEEIQALINTMKDSLA